MGMTHLNPQGNARMVDVSEKEKTNRTAVAAGKVFMNAQTLQSVREGTVKKGDVLPVAQVAGIMAAKKTSDSIPMCHPLILAGADIQYTFEPDGIVIEACVKCSGETGVEREALNAVSVCALTIYDMCKALQKDMVISDIRLLKKSGGKSGDWERKAPQTGPY